MSSRGTNEQASALKRMMPDAWSIFFRGRAPRPAQALIMPRIVAGENLLFAAPTASGKTEAAIAPLFQRHVSFRRNQLGVIYVAPTRALVNDIYARLTDYLDVRSQGTVCRYTGDHHDFASPEGAFCLLATPEALDSLQLMRPDTLRSVRAVVVDEIHLLHGTARGQQLRHVISRIRAGLTAASSARDTFHIVGMTATLDDMDGVARVWLGSASAAIAHGEPREIEFTTLDVPFVRSGDAPSLHAETLRNWMEVETPKKLLVFANSRNRAHGLAATLAEVLRGSRWPVHMHIGILSATERERVESAMRKERFGVCVATSTLEIGIDIGDVDAVVLADAPFTVNSFLQRIGRGNRRSGTCRVLGLAQSPEDKKLFAALLNCARRGQLDDIYDYDRLSVRFQQVLSFAWKGVRDGRPLTLENAAARCGEDHRSVIEDMLVTGTLKEVRGALVPSDEWMDEGDKRRIHTNISGSSGTPVIDGNSGDVVAYGELSKSGSLYVEGGFKQVQASTDGRNYLEGRKQNHRQSGLAQLPSVRGGGGLGRAIVWAMAELEGIDPRRWTYRDGRLLTWGGLTFNRLLAAMLRQGGLASKPQGDEYGVTGVDRIPSTHQLLELLEKTDRSGIPRETARRFAQTSRFMASLSPSGRAQEELNSIPFESFKRWLILCHREDA